MADDRETQFPKLGIVPLYDKELGKTIWVNSSSGAFRDNLDRYYSASKYELETLCRKVSGNYLYVNTREDYVPSLIKLFKVRNRIRK